MVVESSDKTWSTGEGNVKPLQHSCENPMNSMKRQKDTYVYIYSIYKNICLSGCTGLSASMQDLLVVVCGI